MSHVKNILNSCSPEKYFTENYILFRNEYPNRLFNHTEKFGKNERILLEALNCQSIMDWLINNADAMEKSKLSDVFDKLDVYSISANYIESL